MKKTLLLLPALLFLHAALRSQPCNCQKSFAALKSTIETSYIGFTLIATPTAKAAYRRFSAGINKRIQKSATTNCILYLQQYLRYFNDNHLSLEQAVTDSSFTPGKDILEKTTTPRLQIGRAHV